MYRNPKPKTLRSPFDQVLVRVQAAAQQFVQGDSTGIKDRWSHDDNVSILGGGGGHARGWEQVRRSLEGGASLFREGQVSGHVEVDIIARGTSGDLSYTVQSSMERHSCGGTKSRGL
jgi:hypothetical protein